MNSPTYRSDPVSPNTTYVQVDPSTFRAVVQKLTGAPDDPSAQKLPLSGLPSRLANLKPDIGPRRPAFKLHERRPAAKKLELNLTSTTTTFGGGASFSPHFVMPRSGGGGGGFVVSPVSTLEFLARGSPRTPATPCTEEEEEKRAIAEKGFYLHRSPLSTPRGSDPPELLPLFPLCSPRDHTTDHINSSSTTS